MPLVLLDVRRLRNLRTVVDAEDTHERVELRFDRDEVWIVHRGVEVARYRRSYEQGVWLPPPIQRPEPPQALPPVAPPRITVTPPELADYAELCA